MIWNFAKALPTVGMRYKTISDPNGAYMRAYYLTLPEGSTHH